MTTVASLSISREQRKRRFFGFVEVQTEQSQPTTGIPREVPVPRKVIRINLIREGSGSRDRVELGIPHRLITFDLLRYFILSS